jgi:uncharacterized protein (TIGR03086 family)
MTMEPIEPLDRTFRHAQRVIAGITPNQYDNVTPCSEWNVRQVLEHAMGVVAGMGQALVGAQRTEFVLADDPGHQFEQIASDAIAAWRADGVLDQVVNFGAGPMPGRVYANINLLDTATHTWDLAVATGQDATLPDDVAVAAYEASQMIVSPEIRTGRFGAEVAAPADADPTQRLVAFLGRTP